ncbi:polysaccharide deacetylase family protein [Actinopolyspora halophila]|uniref:polysaccharide deacetylase family protein n=1 Tax=Actinopolyspora halophila TaxID=1850 RepID=UPI0003A06D9D|nr:polysaccharide deacetylase family protein [Actinopolyspora halophila]
MTKTTSWRRVVTGLIPLLCAVVLAGCAAPTQAGSDTKPLYLTFDDGPSNATDEILTVLNGNDVRATFFTLGENLAENHELAQRMLAEGHVVATHTWNHRNLTKLSPAELDSQLRRSVNEGRAVGSDSDCIRPPYGATNDAVQDALAEHDLRSVLWNVDPKDWKRPDAEALADRLVETAYPRAVVLLHDGGGNREKTIQALRTALPELRAKGYEFRPVPGC